MCVASAKRAARRLSSILITNNQAEHHGIRNKQTAEIMRWVNPKPCSLQAAHADFDLSYHLVLVTSRRKDVFDEVIAPGLFRRLADYGEAEGFHLERMSLLPDHTHLLVKITPSANIKTSVLGLMNDSWEFMNERYAGVLKGADAYQLWTESFYIGTVGDRTTAMIKSFLSKGRQEQG